MAKKRKNQNNAAAAVKVKVKTQQVTKNKNGKNLSSSSNTKPTFQGFPLHLMKPTVANNKNTTRFSLQELHPGRVWVIPNFFTKQECQAWIDVGEDQHGFEYTAHPATKFIAHRECYRMQQKNAVELADRLYQRLEQGGILPRLQRELSEHIFPPDLKGYAPIGCNPNLRLYKYLKGHSFGKHVDGSNMVEGMGQTEITVLIYLSKCQGGATRFHVRKKQSFAFDPEPGSMLLHVHGDHCLEHEADEVRGGIKYVLRTDIIFGEK